MTLQMPAILFQRVRFSAPSIQAYSAALNICAGVFKLSDQPLMAGMAFTILFYPDQLHAL